MGVIYFRYHVGLFPDHDLPVCIGHSSWDRFSYYTLCFAFLLQNDDDEVICFTLYCQSEYLGEYNCWGRSPGAADGTSCGTNKVDTFCTCGSDDNDDDDDGGGDKTT